MWQVPPLALSRLLFSVWVSSTDSCAFRQVLYKCIDTIQIQFSPLHYTDLTLFKRYQFISYISFRVLDYIFKFFKPVLEKGKQLLIYNRLWSVIGFITRTGHLVFATNSWKQRSSKYMELLLDHGNVVSQLGDRGVILVRKLEGFVGPGLKTWESWILNVQQTYRHVYIYSTESRVSSPEFLFNIHKSSICE